MTIDPIEYESSRQEVQEYSAQGQNKITNQFAVIEEESESQHEYSKKNTAKNKTMNSMQ